MNESSLLSSLHKENIVPNLSHVSQTLKSSLPCSVKTKRAQWYSPCSSPRPKIPLSPDDNLPILKLNHFEKTPRVLFGSVKLGSSKVEELVVWNPHPVSQTLRVERTPVKRGFTVNCSDDESASLLTLEADEEVVLPIKWEPNEAGRCRELIVFKWNETHRLQAILMGSAIDINTKKKRRSVLCNSQALNSPRSKKAFNNNKALKAQSTVVTKCPLHFQGQQHEFGKSIPLIKEITQEKERRETYVVSGVGTPQPEERRETFLVSKAPVKIDTASQGCNETGTNSKAEVQGRDFVKKPPEKMSDEGNSIHSSQRSLDKLMSEHAETKVNEITDKQVELQCVKNVKFENYVKEEKQQKSDYKESTSRLRKQQQDQKVSRPENAREEVNVCLAKSKTRSPSGCEEIVFNEEKLQNFESTETNTTEEREKNKAQTPQSKENESKEKHRIPSFKETVSKGNKKASTRPYAQEMKRKMVKHQVVLPPVAFDVEPTKKLKTTEDKKKKTLTQRNESKGFWYIFEFTNHNLLCIYQIKQMCTLS